MDNNVYVAMLVSKKRIFNSNIFICQYICPIVGLKFGSRLLSSRSKKYLPIFKNNYNFDVNMYLDKEFDFTKDTNLFSDDIYYYNEISVVDDINNLDSILEQYKNKYKDICFFVDCTYYMPYIIKYKKNSLI